MRRLRKWAMPLGLASWLGVAWWQGWLEGIDAESVRSLLEAAGPMGMLVLVAAFVVGNLMGVPGLVFVFAAFLAYGPALGSVVALVGGVAAAVVNVTVLRWAGGGPAEGGPAWIERAMATVETRPVGTTALLRALTVVAPPVNVALALSPVRCRDHALGTALGLVVPIAVYAMGFDCIVGKL